MRSHAILAFAASLGFSAVAAQDYGDFDYPSACQSVCRPVNVRAESCDDQFNTDQDELNCLCTGPDMNNVIPQCQACVSQNLGSDDDDDFDEINQLLSACGFPTTTPTATGATATASTAVFTTVICSPDDDDDDDGQDCDTETLTSTIGQPGPRITVFSTTSTDTDDDGNETETDTDLVTSTIVPTAQTTQLTTTNSNGATTVVTSTTGTDVRQNVAGGPSSSSTGLAVATAVPVMGAGVMGMFAAAVFAL